MLSLIGVSIHTSSDVPVNVNFMPMFLFCLQLSGSVAVTKSVSFYNGFTKSMWKICNPPLHCHYLYNCAGFLNKDSLMYVWDQYTIGLDVAGYHMHFLTAFTATLLIILKDEILNCQIVCIKYMIVCICLWV